MSDADLIVRIAARGDGVTADGRHAALAAPGDRLLGTGEVEAGPGHAVPPCRHFLRCGGCQLQHVGDVAYARFLHDRIVDALHAQGLDAPLIDKPHLSPPRTRRRASLRAERHGKTVVIGFNERASKTVVDVHECHVMLPALFDLIAPIKRLLVEILPDRGRSEIMLTQCDQGVDVMFGGFEIDGLAATEALTAFAVTADIARLSCDEGYGPSVRYMPGRATITLSGVEVPLPEGAFLQATADGEAALVRAVTGAMSDATSVADLFAGLGTFALALRGRVHAVEGARDAVLSLASTRRVAVEHRDLFRQPLSADELGQFDGVILDPPRAGAKEQVAALAGSSVPRIVYVSCNPATFARDAKLLVDGGYRIDRITPVGQFRWSTHVELAAVFSRLR